MRATILAALTCYPGFALADVSEAVRLAKARDFSGSSWVLCAQEVGETLGHCDAEVARADSCAAVVVTFANGFSRILTFSDGSFLRGNTTMSGTGTDTEWQLTDGFFEIRVDDQRFEIPAALVLDNAP